MQTLWRRIPISVRRALKRALRREIPFEAGFTLPHMVLIATHHKAGTVWLQKVFQRIATAHSLQFYSGEKLVPPDGTDIFQPFSPDFDFRRLTRPFRGVHLIRDPRDMIVSATFYHQKSSEAWLHMAQPEYSGRTYQQALNACTTADDKLLFEMEHLSGGVIDRMKAWNYANPDFIEVKYEELMTDVDLKLFHQIFSFLGVPGKAIPSALALAHGASLFSGKRPRGDHVRSGASEQWRQHFKPVHRERFLHRFGDVLTRLGYDTDDEWRVRS